MYPNNFQPQNQMMYGGQMYANVPQPKMTQGLSQQEIQELRKTANAGLSLQISPIDMMKSRCTHKEGNNITLVENPDGSSTCSICGATFTLSQYSTEEVAEMVRTLIDAMQSIKTYFLDMPENVVKDFMPIIPLLSKVPQLYELALNNFNKYDTGLHNTMNSPYGFGMLNMMMNPGAMPGMGFGAAPMGGMNPGMMGGAPMGVNPGMMPGFGMPGMMPGYPQMNPGMGMPGAGYPNMMGPAYNTGNPWDGTQNAAQQGAVQGTGNPQQPQGGVKPTTTDKPQTTSTWNG